MKSKVTFINVLMICLFLGTVFSAYSQSTQLSREEIAIQKAEERLENYRLKLVQTKRDIESADSLFVTAEELEKDAVTRKSEAKDEIKAINKKYKEDCKPAKKKEKSKDRSVSAEGRSELKTITMQYKADLKKAETKLKAAEKDISTAGRMMDKADKKLDLLKGKLKTAEKSYVEAEEALNEKKGGKK